MIASAGIALAVLQFAFALTWVVYAAFLPALVAQVGIDKALVPWILLVDQAIFVVFDWAAGVFADRMEHAVARLGRAIALVAVVSCAAFLALPLVAPTGSPEALAAVVLVWSATSSILRAPPLALAGRHATRPQRAWLAGLYALGLGLAGAVGPSIAKLLAATDPRIPFAATSIIVALATFVLVALPRAAPAAPAPPASGAPGAPGAPRSLAAFGVALALLAIGFQIHGSNNAAPFYLRHAAREDLDVLLPVFWIGVAIASLFGAAVVRQAGGVAVMVGAGLVGAAALAVLPLGGSLAAVVLAQAVAGLGWGGILVGAFAAATARERPGAATGLVFSIFAAATVARIAVVATGLAAAPGVAAVAPLAPPIAWALGTLVVALFALRGTRTLVRSRA